MTSTRYQDVVRAAAREGLAVRGGFHVEPEDAVPPLASGADALSVVLIGMSAASGWAAFESAPERTLSSDPLDRFSARVIGGLAGALDATALFPFGGPPWHPFQRWAERAEPVARSPLGLLVHARFGLWHGYRGALAFAHRLHDLPAREAWRSACLDCVGQPCLKACPVGAFSAQGFARDACAIHLSSNPEPCLDAGCLARAACPLAPDARYSRAQRRFHMSAFRDGVLMRDR